MTKIWYGSRTDSNGYVYKRFVSMTTKDAIRSLKIIRENTGYFKTKENTTDEMYRNQAIKREGNYLFLNHTQSKILGVDKEGYNTAIYIKE
jgi:hypothetical protein